MIGDAQAIFADMAYIPAIRTEDSPLRNLRVRFIDPKDLLSENDRWTKLYESILRGQR
jgi:iron(III) transport system substrate-binding protein